MSRPLICRPIDHRARRVVARSLMLAVVIVLGWAPSAWAHAELTDTEPAAGSVLERPPTEIVLRFTEPVDPVAGAFRVLRSDGTELDDGGVGRVEGDESTLRLGLGENLGNGTYVVAWRAVSADSHPVRGAFTFRVGSSTAEADTAALINRVLSEDGEEPSAGLLLALGRWSAFAGVLLCAGWLLFASVGLSAAVLPRRVAVAAVLGAAGTVVMVASQSVSLAGRWAALVAPGDLLDVVSTRSGGWWAWRIVALAALAVVAVGVQRRPERSRRGPASLPGIVGAAAAVTLVLITAMGGHGATGRWPALGVTATVVHLLAAGLWSAGLVVLGLLAVAARRRRLDAPDTLNPPAAPDEPAGPDAGDRELRTFARRFSSVALVAVAVLVASGLLQSVRQVGSIDVLTTTDYGRLLLAKVAGVVVVVLVAASSRRLVRREHTAELARPVRIEVGLLVAVLALTALLVNVRPAISEATTVASGAAVVGERTAQVVLDPARTGGTALHVYLTSPRGTLDRAQDIAVSATLAERDIGPLTLSVFDAGPNHVTNPDVDLPLPGAWTITVTARYGEFEEVRFDTVLNVRRS